jgi:antitoxin component YwqK of YwqJK toxin-antitoxin module
MNHKEYYSNGVLKCEGELLEIVDCTSRGSGRQIEIDDHVACVECVFGPTFRKKGIWKYYTKKGQVAIIGAYVILDYIGVPNEKNGIWSIFREDGCLLQQIVYEEGKVIEISIFDEDGTKVE